MPYKTKPLSFSIREDLADELDRVANERVVGKSLLVEKALEAYLPTLPPLTSAASSADRVPPGLANTPPEDPAKDIEG